MVSFFESPAVLKVLLVFCLSILAGCVSDPRTEHREMMDLAILIREIASRGEAERALCRAILESVLRYSVSRGDTSFLSL